MKGEEIKIINSLVSVLESFASKEICATCTKTIGFQSFLDLEISNKGFQNCIIICLGVVVVVF